MGKNAKESTQATNSGSHKGFTEGAIVTTKAHPYLREEVHPKIGSYSHLTPPFMVIIEVHHSRKYDTETGERLSSSFKCLYYSTETGKFEDNWFKKEELKFVQTASESLEQSYRGRSFLQLKRKADGENGGIIGLQAILNTVDLELDKTMVYKDSNPKSGIYKEKAMLDFLPPLGTIMSISTVRPNTQYNEKTGYPVMEKGRILAKVRWYNNKTTKFSEQEIPFSALKEVKLESKLSYDKDKVYIYNEGTNLEDSKTKLKAVPVTFHDIIFNHYKYEFRFRNAFTNKILLIKEAESIHTPIDADNQTLIKILNHIPENKFTEFKKNKWYKIKYVDRRRNYTERIIQVREVKKDNGFLGQEGDVIIEANCLLRNGAIRHFFVGRIFRSEELPKAFITIFIEN